MRLLNTLAAIGSAISNINDVSGSRNIGMLCVLCVTHLLDNVRVVELTKNAYLCHKRG